MTPTEALACWERAAEQEIGLILTVKDLATKRVIENLLYNTRKAAGRPDLEDLRIVRPGDAPNELWIIKKSTDMEDLR